MCAEGGGESLVGVWALAVMPNQMVTLHPAGECTPSTSNFKRSTSTSQTDQLTTNKPQLNNNLDSKTST